MTTSILDLIGHTPMVAMRSVGPILGKCEHLNPGGSVKDRLALAIVDDAEARGLLRPGGTIIEATAGNTGLGLALLAAVRGYRLVCVMPEKMSEDKRVALRAVGAEVVITANAPPDDERNFQQVARGMAAQRGAFLADQFCNPVNALMHEATTGPEILEQCGGHVAAFVAGVGTGGTITGVGRYLKAHCPDVRIVLADPVGSTLAGWVRERKPGPDGAYQVEGIGSSRPPGVLDLSVIDEAETVSDAESFAMTRRLIREEALFVGGSSGTTVAAALRVAQRVQGPVVALLPDSWDRYLTRSWLHAEA